MSAARRADPSTTENYLHLSVMISRKGLSSDDEVSFDDFQYDIFISTLNPATHYPLDLTTAYPNNQRNVLRLVEDQEKAERIVRCSQFDNAEEIGSGKAPGRIRRADSTGTSTLEGLLYVGRVQRDRESIIEDICSRSWPSSISTFDWVIEEVGRLCVEESWICMPATTSRAQERTHPEKLLHKIAELIRKDSGRSSGSDEVGSYSSSYGYEPKVSGFPLGNVTPEEGRPPGVTIWRHL